MKVLRFVRIISVLAMALGFAGCAATATNNAAINVSQKEMMLSRAGFLSKTVTTPKQQQQVEKLPVGVVSAVKYKGKLLYVYPTEKKDRVFVGKQAHYNSYKTMLAAKAAPAQHSNTPTDPYAPQPYLTG